jgi:glycine dehydrogenase subunit 2
MKYNPKLCDTVAGIPGLASVHPAAPASLSQGWLQLLVELEGALCEVTGMAAATLQPAAGASGELTGLLLMRAWHAARGSVRTKVIIPDSAHGTNPASVTLGGYQVVTVPSDERGCVDMAALETVLDEDVAGIMLTNPNTLGLFEEDIAAIAAAVHKVGGLLYYDGANLNAILGVVRPGDMGFDIVHMNLHKTFATPHGGGGPGAGPVAVAERLVPFLPGPRPVEVAADGSKPVFRWMTPEQSIGRMHTWHGNTLVLARALAYILANGGDGLRQVAEIAVLNANWIRQRLTGTYDVPFQRPCMHEVVLSVRGMKQAYGVRALDVAKRLLEEGFHSPTVYFPLIVEEALMIEPTETESPQTLEALAESLEKIADEARSEPPGWLAEFPRHTPVRRVDEAQAARTLVPTFDARN